MQFSLFSSFRRKHFISCFILPNPITGTFSPEARYHFISPFCCCPNDKRLLRQGTRQSLLKNYPGEAKNTNMEYTHIYIYLEVHTRSSKKDRERENSAFIVLQPPFSSPSSSFTLSLWEPFVNPRSIYLLFFPVKIHNKFSFPLLKKSMIHFSPIG